MPADATLYTITQPLGIGALLVILCLGGAKKATAQDQGMLRVTTNVPEAFVFADSVQLGQAKQEPFRLEAGHHRLRLAPGGLDSWSAPVAEREVRLAPRETLRVVMRVPYRYRITSTPYDAEVYLRRPEGRKRIGATPLTYEAEQPLQGRFAVEKSGYETAVFEPEVALWKKYDVQLTPAGDVAGATSEVNWSPPERHRTWIDVAALGAALAAGAVAIHYKFKADRLYDKYRSGPRKGDETLRPQFERYDRRSAVALGAMQVGVTIFAVRLAL